MMYLSSSYRLLSALSTYYKYDWHDVSVIVIQTTQCSVNILQVWLARRIHHRHTDYSVLCQHITSMTGMTYPSSSYRLLSALSTNYKYDWHDVSVIVIQTTQCSVNILQVWLAWCICHHHTDYSLLSALSTWHSRQALCISHRHTGYVNQTKLHVNSTQLNSTLLWHFCILDSWIAKHTPLHNIS